MFVAPSMTSIARGDLLLQTFLLPVPRSRIDAAIRQKVGQFEIASENILLSDEIALLRRVVADGASPFPYREEDWWPFETLLANRLVSAMHFLFVATETGKLAVKLSEAFEPGAPVRIRLHDIDKHADGTA